MKTLTIDNLKYDDYATDGKGIFARVIKTKYGNYYGRIEKDDIGINDNIFKPSDFNANFCNLVIPRKGNS